MSKNSLNKTQKYKKKKKNQNQARLLIDYKLLISE